MRGYKKKLLIFQVQCVRMSRHKIEQGRSLESIDILSCRWGRGTMNIERRQTIFVQLSAKKRIMSWGRKLVDANYFFYYK